MTDSKHKNKRTLPIEKVIALNNLSYNSIGDVTPIQSRISRKFYPEVSSYTSSKTMNWNLDIGSSMVNGSTSFLTFNVVATIVGGTAGETVGFASNSDSAMNLFSQATLMKNEIIEEQEALNLLAWHKSQNTTHNDTLFHGYGTVQGFSAYESTGSLGHTDLTVEQTYVIPLSRFLGFFNNPNTLIPGMLLSGCRLKLKLASVQEALFNYVSATGLAGTGDHAYEFTISDPVITLDMYNLTDEARLAVSKLAARKTGLIYNFTTHARHAFTMSGTHAQHQVGMAVSHCLDAFSVSRLDSSLTDIKEQTMAAVDYDSGFKWRYILGSVSYPEEPITNSAESYIAAQGMWSGSISDSHQRNSVKYSDFKTSGLGAMCQSFERSHLQAISGIPLSGNRVLQLDVTNANIAGDTQVTTFMKYVRTVSSYLDGKVVVRY